MNAQNNLYPTTKFVALSDGKSIARVKKSFSIWIITVTLLFFLAVAYFTYQLFIAPIILTEQKPESFSNINSYTADKHENLKLKLYNPNPRLKELLRRSQKDVIRNEFTDEGSQVLQTIPIIFVQQMRRKKFENLQDFIILDLLIHYENLINKFEVKNLKLIFNEYQSKVLQLKNSGDFVSFLRTLKSNKFKFYANLVGHQKYNLELKHFESLFALTEELNHWYNYLNRLPSFLSTYEEQKSRRNLENCTGKNFEKYTEETQKRLFYFAYPFKITEKKLQEINMIINMWSKPLTTEFYNCSMILFKKVLLLSDVNKEIQQLKASCLKYIYVFASHIVYLDNDLELFGVSLAIVAPEWLFLKSIKINLNGINGTDFTNKTASFNESGMPGNPGGNAGDFMGIGNAYEKFLKISANGGNGGKSQNGVRGLDGMHYTRPEPPLSRPSCVSKIKTYNNSFGQKITHYKIFSKFGCGHPGTDGGVGGMGGAGGVITLISDSVKVTKGLNGVTGTPGKGGAGGIGGRDGCFYEVLDEDDETLHPVTKVKCPSGNTLPSGENGKDNYNRKGQIFSPEKENLTVQNTLYQFLRFAGEDFVKNNDIKIISFLRNLNRLDLYNKICVRDAINEYKLLEVLDKIEFYEIFKEKLFKNMRDHPDEFQPVFKYLVPLVLEKMMILKESINFFFIDFKNFLSLVEGNVKTTTELTSEQESVSYFKKKVHFKIEQIKINLKEIKMKSTSLISYGKGRRRGLFQINNSLYLFEELYEGVSHIMITIIDVLLVLMNSEDAKEVLSDNSLKLLRGNYSVVSERIRIWTELPIDVDRNVEKHLLDTLENLRNNNSQKIKENLSNLKDALSNIKESNLLSTTIGNLLETLTNEIEHFLAIFSFLEWEKLDRLFLNSLDSLMLHSNLSLEEDEEVMFLKRRLVDAMNTLQCKLTLHSQRLNFHSFRSLPTCLQLFQNKSVTTVYRNFLQNIGCEEADSFCKNHFKAVFDKNSAVGEFYFWPNAKIKSKLKNLFSGRKINLKADIVNHHLFDKNLIQFRTLKVEFETGNKSHQHLLEILSNFKIEMIHSGYSYFNWKEETYVFLSEKVNLEYSFKVHGDNEPEIYNSLYKKCQDGEINLSPFTIWTLRLLPIRVEADFKKLKPFIGTTNLRLIGTGTYIS